MRKYNLILFPLTISILFFNSCFDKKNETQLNSFSQIIPKGWPNPVYTFKNNSPTQDGIRLGKKLFFDTRLSNDNSISCASCHNQKYAFSDAEKKLSSGIRNLVGRRNTPGLFNLAWNTSFMWDGGVNHIELQPLVPITDSLEMDETLFNVVNKIGNDKEYKKLFKIAFGTDSITSQLIFRAFAQFLGNIISFNSKYDKVIRGENGFKFSKSESKGYKLFKQNCSSCHNEPLFTDHSFRNNGIGINAAKPDFGRLRITVDDKDSLKFKVPSLRNIALTAPYMHDGRFANLEEVVSHYSNGIESFKNTDSLILKMPKFTESEKSNLIAFLNSLTDFEFIKNKSYNK